MIHRGLARASAEDKVGATSRAVEAAARRRWSEMILQRREGQRHPANPLHPAVKKCFRRAADLEGPPGIRNNLAR